MCCLNFCPFSFGNCSVVWTFVFFRLATVVLFTDSDCPFVIFKLFLQTISSLFLKFTIEMLKITTKLIKVQDAKIALWQPFYSRWPMTWTHSTYAQNAEFEAHGVTCIFNHVYDQFWFWLEDRLLLDVCLFVWGGVVGDECMKRSNINSVSLFIIRKSFSWVNLNSDWICLLAHGNHFNITEFWTQICVGN